MKLGQLEENYRGDAVADEYDLFFSRRDGVCRRLPLVVEGPVVEGPVVEGPVVEGPMVMSPFLTVQYRHPRLQVPLFLDVDRRWYTQGNDIFSRVFVLRCLLYQEGASVPFDDHYWLELLDANNFELVRVYPTQYIHLLPSGRYEVKGI